MASVVVPIFRISYFDMYPARDGKPAPWRHGDWLKVNDHGGCIIYGRSDATINRHGLRMGTSELYSAVEALPEVLDSMAPAPATRWCGTTRWRRAMWWWWIATATSPSCTPSS
jgi:hypothetical protein